MPLHLTAHIIIAQGHLLPALVSIAAAIGSLIKEQILQLSHLVEKLKVQYVGCRVLFVKGGRYFE